MHLLIGMLRLSLARAVPKNVGTWLPRQQKERGCVLTVLCQNRWHLKVSPGLKIATGCPWVSTSQYGSTAKDIRCAPTTPLYRDFSIFTLLGHLCRQMSCRVDSNDQIRCHVRRRTAWKRIQCHTGACVRAFPTILQLLQYLNS